MEAVTQDALAVEEPAAPPDPAQSPEAPAGDPKVSNNGTVGGGSEESPAPEQRVGVVDSFREAAPLLRRPFTPEAVKWRVLRGSQVIAYVDARLVIERLNAIVPHLWSHEFEPLPSGLMLCHMTVDGITRSDVGEHTNKKGLYSDALKRAAVHFGVGVSVYAIPSRDMPLAQYGKPRTVKDLDGNDIDRGPYVEQVKNSLVLTADGQKGLREFYQRWLAQTGVLRFGDPIDHGDVADSVGDEADRGEETASDLPDLPMPLTDAKADELRGECRTAYRALTKEKGGRAKLPTAAFESNLRQASTSHEGLEEFAKRIRAMQIEVAGQS